MNAQEPVNPYQAPPTIEPSSGQYGGRSVDGFVSGHTLALWAIIMLVVVMVGRLAVIGYSCLVIHMLPRLGAGGEPTQVEVVLLTVIGPLMSVVGIVAFIASAVTFIMWFRRVHRNLRPLDYRYSEYGAGWTVGAWFIPIGNLIIPYQIMVEIWKGSDPARFEVVGSRQSPRLALVRAWWLFWLLTNGVAMARNFAGHTADSLIVRAQVLIAAYLISIPAALLAIRLIRRIDANQEQCYRLVQERPETAPSEEPSFLSQLAEGNPVTESADGREFAPPPVQESSERDTEEPIPTPWLDKDA